MGGLFEIVVAFLRLPYSFTGSLSPRSHTYSSSGSRCRFLWASVFSFLSSSMIFAGRGHDTGFLTSLVRVFLSQIF